MSLTNDYFVKMVGISKRFGAIHALRDVDFDVRPDEVVALVGDNGAGKSTLVRILSGVYAPTKGEIFFQEEKVNISSPAVAEKLGIEAVHQGFGLVDCMSISRNVFLGQEPTVRKGFFFRFLDLNKMNQESDRILQTIGARSQVNPKSEVGFLSGGEKQSIKIGRAVLFNAKLLIMDEPTMALSVRERHNVLELVRDLKRQGVAVIFISHDIHVVYDICDRVVILEMGSKIGDFPKHEVSVDEIVKIVRREE
jgi:simple sugar transport system ATP-binding protein